jgi:hypothetical protein
MKNGIKGLFPLGHTFCEEDACCREKEPVPNKKKQEWVCIHDVTGCLYNDGHNGCNHSGNSKSPLGF